MLQQTLDDSRCGLSIPVFGDATVLGMPLEYLLASETILAWLVPQMTLVPSVTVTGRSVFSRRVRQGTPSTVVSS